MTEVAAKPMPLPLVVQRDRSVLLDLHAAGAEECRTRLARFAELGTKPATEQEATPEALKAKLESEIARWKPIIQAAGQYAD